MANQQTGTGTGFSDAEKEAMKQRAREARKAKKDPNADFEPDVLEVIAGLEGDDRDMAERIHRIIKAAAPTLKPRLWYGMPAYANETGKAVVFFQPAAKFKARYSTLGFNDDAKLDDGAMWATAYALTKLSKADEARVAELVRKAAG